MTVTKFVIPGRSEQHRPQWHETGHKPFCSWTAIIKTSGNLCSFESCHCFTTVPPAHWHRTSNLGNQAARSNVCMIHNIWLWSRICGGCSKLSLSLHGSSSLSLCICSVIVANTNLCYSASYKTDGMEPTPCQMGAVLQSIVQRPLEW
jgi:hypothetical protein